MGSRVPVGFPSPVVGFSAVASAVRGLERRERAGRGCGGVRPSSAAADAASEACGLSRGELSSAGDRSRSRVRAPAGPGEPSIGGRSTAAGEQLQSWIVRRKSTEIATPGAELRALRSAKPSTSWQAGAPRTTTRFVHSAERYAMRSE